MEILNKIFRKKNKLVQPKIIVEENHSDDEELTLVKLAYEENRSYFSTWFADPKSPTGRWYRVQVSGSRGKFEADGFSLAVAIAKANKEYERGIL